MSNPGNIKQPNQTLYHDFTDAYIHLYQMSKEFYPTARKFVEKTEPEINRYMSKLSVSGNTRSVADISGYMSSFDDFTIAANKVFSDISSVIKRSELLISRKLEIQKSNDSITESNIPYNELMPEFEEALRKLRQIQADSNELEKKLFALTNQWHIIKSKFN